MKKIITLLALVALGWSLKAQAPSVSVTSTPGTTTMTAHFTMGPNTSQYSIFICEPGQITMYATMFGMTVEGYIDSWGIHYTTDTTYTWTELTPNTSYYIYTLAFGSNNVMDSTLVATVGQGSNDTARVTIVAEPVDDTSAHVIVTPNAAAAAFTDMIIEEGAFNNLPIDTVLDYLRTSPYVFYETDDWYWRTLSPNTCYLALGLAYNANNEWGPLAQEHFCTSQNGIEETETIDVTLYPNPTADLLNIDAPEGAHIDLYTLKGDLLMSTNQSQLHIAELPHGLYVVRITADGKTANRIVCKK